MAQVVDPSLTAVWRDRIELQQRRGLSIQALCQEEGVPQGTFSTWKRRLKAEGQAAVLDGKRECYVKSGSTTVTTRAID